MPKAKLELTNLKTDHRFVRLVALACPEIEAAEILVISPVGVSNGVAEGTDGVVGKKAAAFTSRAARRCVLL